MASTLVPVDAEERDIRLDRWFRRHYPAVPHGHLAKLLRTGQVRVDGKRASAGQRLLPGQQIRVPPINDRAAPPPAKSRAAVSEHQAETVREWVIHRDASVIAINKPSGLAVQGGTRIVRNLDAMLDALAFDGERPRLVHRLDKDTSGVLLLARTATAAAKLAEAFRHRDTQKIYWALVVGYPRPASGVINARIAKRAVTPGGKEKMVAGGSGAPAKTLYSTVETCATTAAWLRLQPVTGRTHQLRVHCASIGTPIIGDSKYGGSRTSNTYTRIPGLPKKLHLHAAGITIPHPDTGKPLTVRAPLTGHMAKSWAFLGLHPNAPGAWPDPNERPPK